MDAIGGIAAATAEKPFSALPPPATSGAPSCAGADGGSNSATDPSVVPKLDIGDPWTVEKALTAARLDGPLKGSTSSYLRFSSLLERVKLTKREGWKRHGILQGESVADHSYRMAAMVMFPPPPLASFARRLDSTKCMKMCLIHDIAESLVGDITPADDVPKKEKRQREDSAMNYIRGLLLGQQGDELLALFTEFENATTPESMFVQDLDKIELLLQMIEYEKRGKKDLSEFAYVATRMLLPEARQWAEDVLKEREEYRKGITQPAKNSVGMERMQDQYYGARTD